MIKIIKYLINQLSSIRHTLKYKIRIQSKRNSETSWTKMLRIRKHPSRSWRPNWAPRSRSSMSKTRAICKKLLPWRISEQSCSKTQSNWVEVLMSGNPSSKLRASNCMKQIQELSNWKIGWANFKRHWTRLRWSIEERVKVSDNSWRNQRKKMRKIRCKLTHWTRELRKKKRNNNRLMKS